MINILFSRVCVLTCGTLYPGYMSFKTVRAKKAEDYVKWMMYWIVFALFTASEAVTDIFFTWLPFYYEFKVALILWLLPTAGNGSSFIYRKCIHPLLKKHETHVDHHLEQFREKGQDLVLQYMREAALYVGRGIINIINKNVPSGVLGLLANNNVYDNTRAIQISNNVIIEEVEDENDQTESNSMIIEEELEQQHIIPKKPNPRKKLARAPRSKKSEETQTVQERGRRTRSAMPEVDYNLNES